MINEEIIKDVTKLKDILIASATGNSGVSDNEEYINLRTLLMNNKSISFYLPDIVKNNRNLTEFWDQIKGKYSKYIERRAYIKDSFSPIFEKLEKDNVFPFEEALSESIDFSASESIKHRWQVILNHKNSDSEIVLAACYSLLEAVCKYILDEKKVSYNKDDLPKLYGKVLDEIDLNIKTISDSSIKRLVGMTSNGCQLISEIRNAYSISHTKDGKIDNKLEPFFAEFTINLTGSICQLLFSKFEILKKN